MSNEQTTVTGGFYRIPEDNQYVWIRIELYRYENGEHTFIDCTHFQLEVGVKDTVIVGVLLRAFFATIKFIVLIRKVNLPN
jgi:hypothetical protein